MLLIETDKKLKTLNSVCSYTSFYQIYHEIKILFVLINLYTIFFSYFNEILELHTFIEESTIYNRKFVSILLAITDSLMLVKG